MKSRTIQGKAWSSLTTILQVSDKKKQNYTGEGMV